MMPTNLPPGCTISDCYLEWNWPRWEKPDRVLTYVVIDEWPAREESTVKVERCTSGTKESAAKLTRWKCSCVHCGTDWKTLLPAVECRLLQCQALIEERKATADATVELNETRAEWKAAEAKLDALRRAVKTLAANLQARTTNIYADTLANELESALRDSDPPAAGTAGA